MQGRRELKKRRVTMRSLVSFSILTSSACISSNTRFAVHRHRPSAPFVVRDSPYHSETKASLLPPLPTIMNPTFHQK